MTERVVLPKLGLTATSARLVAWLVEIGQQVEADAQLCEIETDKTTVVVDSPYAGTLLARAEIGLDIPVGGVLALIGPGDASVDVTEIFGVGPADSTPAPPSATTTAPPPTRTGTANTPREAEAPRGGFPSGPRVFASPAARLLAAQLGIDLGTVVGTGPGSRITIEDVELRSRADDKRGG